MVALEENAALARQAETALAAAGAGSVVVATGPLTAGWPAGAPYDMILFDGATEIVPEIVRPAIEAERPNRRDFWTGASEQMR